MSSRTKKADVYDTIREFHAYSDKVEREAFACMRNWASRLTDRAASLAPVKTGRLKRSIAFGISQDGRHITAIYGTNLRYARFVEFGTNRIKVGPPEQPRTKWPAKQRTGKNPNATMPFLRTAWAQLKQEFIRDLEQVGGRVK